MLTRVWSNWNLFIELACSRSSFVCFSVTLCVFFLVIHKPERRQQSLVKTLSFTFGFAGFACVFVFAYKRVANGLTIFWIYLTCRHTTESWHIYLVKYLLSIRTFASKFLFVDEFLRSKKFKLLLLTLVKIKRLADRGLREMKLYLDRKSFILGKKTQ